MPKKTIEKPRLKQPTAEEMEAFVQGGLGKDTDTQKPVKEETRDSMGGMARLTVDLPKSTHTRFKVACTLAGTKMNEEIRQFIERRSAELERAAG